MNSLGETEKHSDAGIEQGFVGMRSRKSLSSILCTQDTKHAQVGFRSGENLVGPSLLIAVYDDIVQTKEVMKCVRP
jgi:hypothetical protein